MWGLADSGFSMLAVSPRAFLILTCLTKGYWPCDAQSPHLGLEFLRLAFWHKIPFCFLQSLGYCQPPCLHSLLLSTAKCLIFHLWLTGLPDTTIHKAKPLVLALKGKSSTISTPTLDYFCPITACAPAYQGYFLSMGAGFPNAGRVSQPFWGSKSSCYKRHTDPKQITRGNSA